MSIEAKPGQSLKVTISKSITREGARKTIERLFMKDRTISDPLDARSRNFKPQPKRRGGRIWTKYANKIHPNLVKGTTATVKATPQSLKDLASVSDFVTVE